MDYREFAPPPELGALVAAFWTLDVGGDAAQWHVHRAVPDGCLEVIFRHRGRSVWRREQPACFATGLATVPAELRLSGDASFSAVRLWPWSWPLLTEGDAPPPNDWAVCDAPALTDAASAAREPEVASGLILGLLAEEVGAAATITLGRAILASGSAGEVADRTGRSPRWLQRWSARSLGVPLSTWLRLRRFTETLGALQAGDGALADRAAAQGYADQAHMARDFREFAGAAASDVRRRARGPFVARN